MEFFGFFNQILFQSEPKCLSSFLSEFSYELFFFKYYVYNNFGCRIFLPGFFPSYLSLLCSLLNSLPMKLAFVGSLMVCYKILHILGTEFSRQLQ